MINPTAHYCLPVYFIQGPEVLTEVVRMKDSSYVLRALLVKEPEM